MIWEDCNNSPRDRSSKYICRISWRKHEPLGLSSMSRTTIFDLPREVRDEIYRLSLTAPGPIMVWNGWSSDQSHTLEHRATKTQTFSVYRAVPELLGLAFNLLHCSRTISREAAEVFYCSNTFAFDGPADWSPLYLFLRMVGAHNRSHLTSLSIQTQVKWGLRDEHGVHVSTDRATCDGLPNPWPFGRVVPVAVAVDPRPQPADREVEYLNRLAIHACFRLLAEPGRALALHVGDCMWHAIPGVPQAGDSPFSRSMDAPNVVERLRQSCRGRRVEVLWTVTKRASTPPPDKGALEQAGWEVQETRPCAAWPDSGMIEMILRRGSGLDRKEGTVGLAQWQSDVESKLAQ